MKGSAISTDSLSAKRVMLLILRITSGPRKGQFVVLRDPQEARFGRNPGIDEQFVDPKMSRQHFHVFPQDHNWLIKDLGSSGGTYVNGHLKSGCVLRHGDTIQAGGTTFLAEITGSNPEIAPPINPDDDNSFVAKVRQRKVPIPFTAETCDSGLALFRGDFESVIPGVVDPLTPAQLVLALRQSPQFQPWLVIDFYRLGTPRPETLPDNPQYLIDWLGGTYAAAASPELIDLHELPFETWQELANSAWGQDALIVLYSPLQQVELMNHIRKCLHGHGGSIVGLCWPSVLASILANPRNGILDQFLQGISGALCEFSDLPETWQLFTTHADARQELASLGFRQQSPQSLAVAATLEK